MPEAPLLRTEALTRAYGSLIAVDRVDVAVRRGELRSIIGPNGAGKTTFFRLISGETTPTAGRVWFGEREITGLPQHAIARLGITKSYQITNVFPHLSVHENVRVAVQGWTRSFNFWSRADALTDVTEQAFVLLRTVGLAAKAGRLAAHLAHGEKRHLEIAIALASQPQLLLLDEPTAGMAPGERGALMALTTRIARERGLTVLFTEHDMDVVFAVADRIMVLHQGRVIADGDPAAVRASPEVQAVYLGEAP
jgi:branched-chain amino acid transport system ATP-binding protein